MAERNGIKAAVCILLFCLLLCGCGTEPIGTDAADAGALLGAAHLTGGHTLAAVPAGIRSKTEIYPDSISYALLYVDYAAEAWSGDLSGDMDGGEVPLLLQWDRRWGYQMYGTDYMGINGCAPTALATVYAGLTGDTQVTPYDVAQYAVQNGLYLSGQGTRWELMEVGGAHYGLDVRRLWKDERSIRSALAEGKLLTARVGKGDFTNGGHFIVICGIDEQDMLTIRDPNSRENSERQWAFAQVMEQSSCWWSFES